MSQCPHPLASVSLKRHSARPGFCSEAERRSRGPHAVKNEAARFRGSAIPLVSRSFYSYKALTSPLSAQRVTDSDTLKPHEGVGVKHQHDAKLRADSPDGDEIFHPEAPRTAEKIPPRRQLQAEQSHGSPCPPVFIKMFPDCNRELKMKFCTSLANLPATKSIKSST